MALIEFKGLVKAIRELAAAIRGDHRAGINPRVLREVPKGVTITRADPQRRATRELLEREVAKMGLSPQDARRRVAMLMKQTHAHTAAHHRREVSAPIAGPHAIDGHGDTP